jgi:hypothetical protein
MDRGILANAIGFSGEAPMDQRVKDEVLATYAVYAKAFLANDIHAIDQLIQYPLAYIGDGRTTMVDAYPVKPAELMAAKQWYTTRNLSCEVVFASVDKAHLILRAATRVRSDGSPIETVSAFYALTRTPSGWKFFAMSDIAVSA